MNTSFAGKTEILLQMTWYGAHPPWQLFAMRKATCINAYELYACKHSKFHIVYNLEHFSLKMASLLFLHLEDNSWAEPHACLATLVQTPQEINLPFAPCTAHPTWFPGTPAWALHQEWAVWCTTVLLCLKIQGESMLTEWHQHTTKMTEVKNDRKSKHLQMLSLDSDTI